MFEVKNQFAKHVIFWLLTLPILAILLMPAFIAPHEFTVDTAEKRFFQDVMDIDVRAVSAQADLRFKHLFVDTGAFGYTKSVMVSGGVSAGKSPSPGSLSSFSGTYHTALWLMLYRAIWRIQAMWPAAIAIVLAMGIPSLVDGLAVRARKSYTFDFHNPVYFWTASHSLIIVFGIGAVLPLLPMAMTPLVIAAFTALLCTSVWITAANFQTGN